MGTSQRSSNIKQKLNHGMQWYFHMYSIVQYTIINTHGSGKEKKNMTSTVFHPNFANGQSGKTLGSPHV